MTPARPLTPPDPVVDGTASRRLQVRAANPSDAAVMYAWRAEESVREHQPLADVTVAQIRAELANQRITDLYRGRGDKFQWIVLADQRAAGWITLVVTNWEHGLAEVGYALGTRHQGRGLMVRAIELLLADLFLNTTLERIEARCTVGNRASQTVLDNLGFRREGRLRDYFVLRGRRVDNYLYAMLRRDWMG